MTSIDFMNALKASRCKVLACVLIDQIGEAFFRRQERDARYIKSALVIFFFELFLLLIAALIEKDPLMSILAPLMLACSITSIGLAVHTYSFDYTVETLGPSLGELVNNSEDVRQKAYSWLQKVPGLKSQLLLSLIGATIAVLALVSISNSQLAPFRIYSSYYVAIGFTGFSLTQGAFWCILTPSSIHQICKMRSDELSVSRLNPSQTPIIVSMSRVLSNYALDYGIAMTLCVLTFIALKPSTSLVAIRSVLVFLLVGYLVTSFTFFYSQFLLSAIIRREKDHSIRHFNAKANEYFKKLDGLDDESFERMKNIYQLVADIEKTRNTAIDFTALRSYVSSLIVPMLTYLVGIIDWIQVLKVFSALFQ